MWELVAVAMYVVYPGQPQFAVVVAFVDVRVGDMEEVCGEQAPGLPLQIFWNKEFILCQLQINRVLNELCVAAEEAEYQLPKLRIALVALASFNVLSEEGGGEKVCREGLDVDCTFIPE